MLPQKLTVYLFKLALCVFVCCRNCSKVLTNFKGGMQELGLKTGLA